MKDVHVYWRPIADADDAWSQVRCLYAYLAPHGREVLYIGKAWGVTVRGRWSRSGKSDFWDDLEEQRRIYSHRVLVGEVALLPDERLTHELLCDIESLLIYEVQPWGNVQCQESRIERFRLAVACRGAWPLGPKLFRDAVN